MLPEISTDLAPEPRGHYVQARRHAGLIFVSNQLPLTADPKLQMPPTIGLQTAQVIRNVEAILRAAGASLSNVLSATVYIASMSDWPEVDAVYCENFREHRPARTVAHSPELHLGARVAMQVIATDPTAVTFQAAG